MNHILSMDGFLFENENSFNFNQNDFTHEHIIESIEYLNSNDDQLLEAWYNTILDFAALLPVVGSVAEGINLVSYAKQGEFLLAGLCAIGLIPIFGQYIGAGGSILVKALGKGVGLGAGLLKPLTNAVAKFFPKIVTFLKGSKFLAKFSGIAPFVGKMIKALKSFILKGGGKLADISKDPSKMKALRSTTGEIKAGVNFAGTVADALGMGKNKIKPTTQPTYAGYGSEPSQQYQMPVPKEAYMNYQGTPLKNIRPYTDTEISQAEMSQNWDMYLN
jgi:hypothetical protein